MKTDLLKERIEEGLKIVGSGRTHNYFLKQDIYKDNIDPVVNTIQTLRSSLSKNGIVSITVDEVEYQFNSSEYKVPTKLHTYVRSGVVFFNEKAMEFAEPYYTYQFNDGLGEEDNITLLTPDSFNLFWTRFNANQDVKISVDAVPRTPLLLTDFQFIKVEGKSEFASFNPHGSVNIYDAHFIDEITFTNQKYYFKELAITKESVSRWLFAESNVNAMMVTNG